MALKTGQLGVLYWDDALPLAASLEEGGTLEAGAYLAAWKGLAGEAAQRLDVTIADAGAAKARLEAASVFVLAHRPVGGARGARGPGPLCCGLRAAPAASPAGR